MIGKALFILYLVELAISAALEKEAFLLHDDSLVVPAITVAPLKETEELQNFNPEELIYPKAEILTHETILKGNKKDIQSSQSRQVEGLFPENNGREADRENKLIVGNNWKPFNYRTNSSTSQVQECPFQNGCVVNAAMEDTLDGCWDPAMPAMARCMIPEAQRVKCYWPILPEQVQCRRINGVSECLCSN